MQKEITRFTFDCPSSLHSMAKMKASSCQQSLRDYIIGLVVNDISENPTRFVDAKSFQQELDRILDADSELMRRLKDK